MKKLIAQTLFTVVIGSLNISCSNNRNLVETPNYSISNFSLEQLHSNGDLHFKMNSEEAFINQYTNDIKSQLIELTIFDNNIPLVKVSGNLGFFYNKDNSITLEDNILLIDQGSPPTFTVKADNIKWNIKKREIDIRGNIQFNYKSSKLLSEKAKYYEDSQKLIIEDIQSYQYYNESLQDPVLTINADSAILDNRNKKLTFMSSKNRVESTFQIQL